MNVGIFTYTVEMCINCVFTAWYSRQACSAAERERTRKRGILQE